MRKHCAGVAGLVLLAGCVSGPGLLSGNGDYGVGVVRPGMTEKQVDALIGQAAAKLATPAANPSEVVYATGLHVRYDAGLVQGCWSEGMVTSGAGTPAVEADLAAVMKPGATPALVAERLGPPAFGFEKKSGVVALYYPRPGVEVTFTDGGLTVWRRTRPEPSANPGPTPPAQPAGRP